MMSFGREGFRPRSKPAFSKTLKDKQSLELSFGE